MDAIAGNEGFGIVRREMDAAVTGGVTRCGFELHPGTHHMFPIDKIDQAGINDWLHRIAENVAVAVVASITIVHPEVELFLCQ